MRWSPYKKSGIFPIYEKMMRKLTQKKPWGKFFCMDSRCYRFYPQKLRRNIESLRKEFGFRLKNFNLAYSFKTNCHPLVLTEIKKLGVTAEVVSTEEYNTALACGFSEGGLIYNGVCKEKELVYRCALAGGIVYLDNAEELSWAEEYFEQNEKPLAVGLRLNFEIGNGIKSRFGIEVGSTTYKKVVELSKEGKITVKGLSCHFTAAKQKKFWIKKTEGLAKAAKDFPSIEYLDFGGSLAGSYEKMDPRKSSAGEEIDFKNVAGAIYETLREFRLEKKRIILECGTAIAGSAFDMVAKVLHIKGNGFVILDVSFKDMMIPALSDSVSFEIVSGGGTQKMLNDFTITGCTCLENDIMKKGFNGKLAVGDFMVFKNVGAYSLCFSNSFIRNPLPVEIGSKQK